MPIIITSGDLLSQEVDAIINTVNCVGVMGKGIALQFKNKWVDNFKAYEKACKDQQVITGKMFVHDLGRLAGKPYFIINFPTKAHWRSPSKLEYIVDGLDDLISVIRKNNIKSIALPPLGCGNGGLDWAVVRPLIEKAFSAVPDVEVRLFEPKGAPDAASMVIRTQRPKMTSGRAVLVKLLDNYSLSGNLISQIEAQKLGYFGDVRNLIPRLNFTKNQFGPFSHPLNKALEAMNGHFIVGLGDNDTARAQISVDETAVEEADAFLAGDEKTLTELKHIAELVEGFDSPYGMELLSTVHWAASHDSNSTDLSVVATKVHNWSPENPRWGARKKTLMPEHHIQVALDRLISADFLKAA